ncbi:MAG: hypothetical protein ABSF34_22090 [Verrucomicrobiota bacterium]|jgi:hypothetical protein
MGIKILQIISGILIIAMTATPAHAEFWYKPYYTNALVVANSLLVIDAIKSGNEQSASRINSLVGSQVAFAGWAGYAGEGTNFIIDQSGSGYSNAVTAKLHITLIVELKPWRYVRTLGASSFVEVLGTLKRVDVKNRVIYIRAKPSYYRKEITL